MALDALTFDGFENLVFYFLVKSSINLFLNINSALPFTVVFLYTRRQSNSNPSTELVSSSFKSTNRFPSRHLLGTHMN